MKKLPKRRTRKLTHTGKVSYSVIIPKDFINKLKWRERQVLVVQLRGKSVIIRKR